MTLPSRMRICVADPRKRVKEELEMLGMMMVTKECCDDNDGKSVEVVFGSAFTQGFEIQPWQRCCLMDFN